MASRHVLVVDDEVGIRELLSDILTDEGYRVTLSENAQAAREKRLAQRPDLVLLDIWMPDSDGISLLKEWGNAGLLTMPVVMMSGHGTIDTAVEATRIGAFDFLEKPIALQKLLKTVAAALKHSESHPKIEMNLASFGKSAAIHELKQRLERIALTKSHLFLVGNKGGSVELCARFLHDTSTPWVSVTDFDKLVSAPQEILEAAKDGIVFVHEIAHLTKPQQKGLLLMLQKSDKFQARVVCASTQNLPQLVESVQLENALVQALSGNTLKVPALNDHREDIPDLAVAMASLAVEKTGASYKSFDVAALNALRNAEWPGDLAQLEAVVQNLMLSSLGEKVELEDVNRVLALLTDEVRDPDELVKSMPVDLMQSLREARDDFERFYFQHHMKSVSNNMSKLAEIASLERTHLYRKLKQLGIKIKG
jgi:two-component system nitrogen regulation response regulator NtrX